PDGQPARVGAAVVAARDHRLAPDHLGGGVDPLLHLERAVRPAAGGEADVAALDQLHPDAGELAVGDEPDARPPALHPLDVAAEAGFGDGGHARAHPVAGAPVDLEGRVEAGERTGGHLGHPAVDVAGHLEAVDPPQLLDLLAGRLVGDALALQA